MADRWRDDDRRYRGGYTSERSEAGRPRGDFGDYDRDFGQDRDDRYGREQRSTYAGWSRPDDAREYDDYTRSTNRRRPDDGGFYGQPGPEAQRYRAGYEGGRYGADYGGRSGLGSSRSYGPSGDYGDDRQRRGGRGRLDGLRGFRESGYDFDEDELRRAQSYRGGAERSWTERAGDEVRAWFGNEDAERRRSEDRHRGRGPKGYTRSDERIREDVCDRLSDDWNIDASEIEVQVQDGEVTLSGTVGDRGIKRRAEDVAEDISGVRNVQNNLRVQAPNVGASSGLTNPGGDTAAFSSGTARSDVTGASGTGKS